MGHQPGFRKRSSVLNCLSIVAGSCADEIMDETTRATINNAEHAAFIKNSFVATDGSTAEGEPVVGTYCHLPVPSTIVT